MASGQGTKSQWEKSSTHSTRTARAPRAYSPVTMAFLILHTRHSRLRLPMAISSQSFRLFFPVVRE